MRCSTPPAQPIGLSATVRSASDVAAFLGGDRPVTVVNPPAMRHPADTNCRTGRQYG